MSLADKLAQAAPPFRGLPCPIAALLPQLDERDRVELLTVLEMPPGTPGRMATTTLAAVLASEGHPIHYKGVERHRNRLCRCFSGTS